MKQKHKGRGRYDVSGSFNLKFSSGDGTVLGVDVSDNKEQQEFVRLMNDSYCSFLFCDGVS